MLNLSDSQLKKSRRDRLGCNPSSLRPINAGIASQPTALSFVLRTSTDPLIAPLPYSVSTAKSQRNLLPRIAMVLSLAALMLPQLQAIADDSHTLKGDAPTGSYIPRAVAKSSAFSLDKKYDELSEAEKKVVREMYENLPDTDEPPYPLNGLKPIVKQIRDLQQALLTTGWLSLDVMIDSTGAPQSVSVYKSPDKEMTQYVAVALMNAKYKPGKCSGVPCKMAYRFDFDFVVSR